MPDLRIGCAGWSYEDWVGPVYSSGLSSGHWLEAYADWFSIVEIDSTFYGLPTPAVVNGWIEKVRTRPRFTFSAKLSQTVTHVHLPKGDRAAAKKAIEEFVDRVVAPLEQAQRLEAVLVQLPPTFDAFGDHSPRDPSSALSDVLEALRPKDRRVAVEFRHPSWYDHVGEYLDAQAAETLTAHKVSLAHVDGLGGRLTKTRTANWSYFRFHGRRQNIPAHERGLRHAPYDYLYGQDELAELARTVTLSARQDERTLVIFNNHFQGKAVQNAADLMPLLGLNRPSIRLSQGRNLRLDDFAGTPSKRP